jgi:hypothetical protein
MSRLQELLGCRKVLAGAFASTVMIGMGTSGALAAIGCAGTAGTSAVTSNPTQLNLQCLQPIFITGHPLQSFGGSLLVRTNATTAYYYLADQSNLGIDVVNATNMTYKTRLVPPSGAGTPILNSIGAITGYKGQDPTGGFMGSVIYTQGPANVATARAGTVEVANSGPNGMAVYVNPNDKTNNQRWLVVADGTCWINENGGGYSSPAAGGSMRACSEPADPSVAGTVVAKGSFTTYSPNSNFPPAATVTNYVSQQNPLLSTANCATPGPQYLSSLGLPTKTVCYPQNHQSNVKVFDLQKNTFVAVFPTGGGCIDAGYQNSVGAGSFQIAMNPCSAPLGLYAPPSAAAPYGYSMTGNGGRSYSADVAIGVDSHDGQVYVMVTNPGDNTPRNIGCASPTAPASAAPNAPPLSGPQVVGVSCQEKLTAPLVAILGPSTGANGGCSENAPAAGSTTTVKPTSIQPWDDVIPSGGPGTGIQGLTGFPYMTLFTMDPTTGYLTYRATIRIDDHQSTSGAQIGTNGSVNGPVPGSPGALPNARQMIVESGFRGCDNKGRRGPELGQITWNPKAGVGGAFLMAIPNVLNNPPICYLASMNNLCGPPTTNAGAPITVTTAAATAPVPPGPGAFAVNFWAQSYIPGPWLQNGDPSQGGYPAGGCIYPTGAATNNLVGSVNNQANGGFEWDCDGALAMIDPVYVYKGPKQPNILTGYPMWNPTLATPGYGVYVGQPYDGACVSGPTCIADPYNTYPLNLANCPKFLPAGNPTPALPQAACPNHLVSAGVNYPAPAGPLGNGIVFQPTTGSIGGVVYLPYCSPGSIELGPTDIPGGWDGKAAGDVSSLTKVSTGRTSTFANIFLGCNPYYNGNAGTGQGQLTVNIQENYSLALNTLSATSQLPGCTAGILGVGCGAPIVGSPPQNWVPSAFPACADPRTLAYTYATALFPFPQNGVSCAFNDFYLPGPYPATNPVPMFALNNFNKITPMPWGCIAQYPATPPGNGGGTCGGVNPFIPPNAVASALCTVSGTTIPPSPSTPTCPNATGNQVMAGMITTPNLSNNAGAINGVTEAKFNMTNASKDPHWWVAVGGRLWTAGSIAGAPGADGQGAIGVATKGPVIGYIDALTNTTVEYTPTSSGSNTIALDEQNYVAFLPVNGVQNAQLPAGDFTKNGQNLCGNATTVNGLLSGPGCVIVFRQQYLSPLGTSKASGN